MDFYDNEALKCLTEENWPVCDGRSSDTTKCTHAWVGKICNVISNLIEKVKSLEEENKKLKAINSSPSQPSYSKIASLLIKPGSSANAALIKAVKIDNKLHENKAKNLVIVGVPESDKTNSDEIADDDIAQVELIMKSLNKNVKIVHTHRQKSRSPILYKTDSSSNTSEIYPANLVVRLENEITRNDIISSAKNLANTCHKNIFIRPDRTPAEQICFNSLLKERKERNNELEKIGKLNSPFRYVIRGERVRCVDVTKTLLINGHIKHPFADKEAKETLKNTSAKASTSSTKI